MIRSLEIDGYRGFENFKLEGLGRINVLVGENGSGKTSLLEAVALLGAETLYSPLARIQSRRGMGHGEFDPVQGLFRHVTVHGLFRNRTLERSGRAKDGQVLARMIAQWGLEQGDHTSVLEFLVQAQSEGIPGNGHEEDLPPDRPENGLGFRYWTSTELEPGSQSDFGHVINRAGHFTLIPGGTIQNFSWSTLADESLVVQLGSALENRIGPARRWDSFDAAQATPLEARMLEQLRVLDERIDEYAVKGFGPLKTLALRRSGEAEALPISLHGEGMVEWASIVEFLHAKDAPPVLLFDELFSAVHHSMHARLWVALGGMLPKSSQLFASTHSNDCIGGLRAAMSFGMIEPDDVRVFRLQQGQPAVVYEPEVFLAAGDVGAEVR